MILRTLMTILILGVLAAPAIAQSRQGLPSDDTLCSARSCPRMDRGFWPQPGEPAPTRTVPGAGR